MKKITELIVFLSLALGIHVLMAMRSAEDGGDADGAGGDAFVSITGAPASIETVLADWTAAPTHQAQVVEIEQPELDITDAINAPAMALHEAPNAEIKIAALQPKDLPNQPDVDLARTPLPTQPTLTAPTTPTLQVPETAPAPELRETAPAPVTPLKRPTLRPPEPTIDQAIDTPEPAPELPPEPVKKPKPKPTPKKKPEKKPDPNKKVADKASSASAGAATQKAAGAGKSNQAGSSKKSNALGKGQEASLMSVWAGKIQSRLQRGVRIGKVKATSNRVVIRLKVAPNGRLQSASVVKSSGSAKVDQAVLTSVRRIGKFAKAPKQLTKSSYGFTLPVRVK
ncbi:TonB family protein [Shimia sp. MIT910701]|jgi:protein TonB|uniref:TonB family protein n=1 Tax=Shimia sp. MIT910701 TaxID=3096987 RepID=UPI00399A6AAD